MRYQFLISAGAQEDMQACRSRDSWAATRIAVLLREVSTDIVACEAVVDERTYEGAFSVSPLWHLQDRRINAYRVRLVEVQGWRLITAVDHRQQRVALLSVMERSRDYEADASLIARIEREYDGFGFAKY